MDSIDIKEESAIDYQEFCRLIAGGETQNCIFMKECNAFQDSVKSNAELTRNIIALSNNETPENFIIIGISGDGDCNSVENDNLNDDTLQDFCKTSIAPVPVVQLERYTWDDAPEEIHKNKTFVVIRVEAKARQCFRFNRNFSNPKENCYFKSGEVWVRHNMNTDFASPEEIKGLFEKKVVNQSIRRIDYARLPYTYALPYVLDELEQLAGKAGGKTISDTDPFITRGGPSTFHHLVIPAAGKPLLLRIVPVEKCVEKGQLSRYNNIYLTFEHGLLLVSLGEISETAADWSRSKSKESWGWFCTHDFWHQGKKERNLNLSLPEKVKSLLGVPSALCFAFENINSNESLWRSWNELLTSLATQQDLMATVATNRDKIDTANAFYIKEGCPLKTNKTFQPKTLLGNEMWEPQKYGNVLLTRKPEICKALGNLLDKMKL